MTVSETALMTEVKLQAMESIHVLHPGQIAAFQGEPGQRKDRLLRIGDMYRKRKWIESVIEGPAALWLSLPRGFFHHTLEIGQDSDLLFLFRHVLYYSAGMSLETKWLSLRKSMGTGDLMRVRFTGPGTLGLLSSGPLYEVRLHEHKPMYIDTRCLVAFPSNATLRLAVYGNSMASQHMPYQWEMTGRGSVLLQAAVPNARLETEADGDSLFRRILRELVPFGGIWFK